MIEPIKCTLSSNVDVKSAIPDYILKGTPWHWNAQKIDHSDEDAFQHNVNHIDWKSLSDWAITKANKVKTPHKYFWWDEKNEKIMHGPTDTMNGYPYYEQALLSFRDNPMNQHNTQYFKFANEDLEEWYDPMLELFPNLKHVGISLFVQPPGHCIPSHVDTYSSFKRRTGVEVDYTRLKRYMIFVSDWDWGHFFNWGNHCINQWKAGDFWDLKGGVYHASANAGVTPKITIHWSGELID